MMKINTTFTASLISGLITGWGTYELLRDRGNHSLNNKDESIDKETQTENEKTIDDNTEDTIIKQKVQSTTYKEFLASKNLTLIDANTDKEALKNILLHRMFPHYRKPFNFSPNQMFEGSPEINFTGEEKDKDSKTLYILNKNTDEETESLKNACIIALEKSTGNDDSDPNIYKLKAWCAIPTIKDVLLRHKFEIPKNNDQWKEILKSEWITNSSYHDKQSFLSTDEMNKLSDNSETEENKIQILKNKCTTSLNKTFTRTNFPATKDFLGSNADEFQESTLFCTVPTTAENYIKKAMQGDIHSSIPKDIHNDYCYEEGKDINYYKNIKTTDAMNGKSFWCAVRMIYHKQATPKE